MKNEVSFGKIDFVGQIKLFGGLSLLFVILSIGYLAWHGISWGIDFRGGSEVQVKFSQPIQTDEIRKLVDTLNFKEASLQSFGDGDEYVIRFQTEEGQNEKETSQKTEAKLTALKDAVLNGFAQFSPEIRRVDTVGPQVGAELKRNGFLAVFYCLLVILVYVGLRFDYKYSPGAVVCLFHDATITLAIFVMVGKEVNVPVLAAILTLLGFSLNDTIVVFDRIRETEGLHRERGMKFIINKAINDMLGRTFITAGAVLTSAASLWILADGVVADIAMALTIGILFGTYSSIYVAAPLILLFENLKGVVQPSFAKGAVRGR